MVEMTPVLIVLIVMAAIVLKARYRYLDKHGASPSPEERIETQRLREEVTLLKDRIKVLERIAVDKEDTLTRQIEQLRDR